MTPNIASINCGSNNTEAGYTNTIMITIIHGEHAVHSRDKLTTCLSEAHAEHSILTRMHAKELTLSGASELFSRNSLFAEKEIVVIEELHSLIKSKQKDALIKLIAAEKEKDIILWEKRELTATMLKPFQTARVHVFPLSKKLFSFIEKLGSYPSKEVCVQQVHQVYEQDGAYFLFAMLCRQVRMLISAHDDGKLKGAPFMIAKIKKQAQNFTLPQLLQMHTALLKIDTAEKRSKSALSLEQQLDLFCLSL